MPSDEKQPLLAGPISVNACDGVGVAVKSQQECITKTGVKLSDTSVEILDEDLQDPESVPMITGKVGERKRTMRYADTATLSCFRSPFICHRFQSYVHDSNNSEYPPT